MEKTPEQTAKATQPGSERARFSVPTLSVPTLSHGRISNSKSDSAHEPTRKAAEPAKSHEAKSDDPASESEPEEVDSAPSAEEATAKEASTEAAPAKAEPAKTAPAKTAPAKTALAKTAPAKTALVKTGLVTTALAKTAVAKSAITKSALATTAVVKSTLAKTTPAKTKPQAKVVAPVEVAKKRTRGKPTTVLLVKGLSKRFDETVAVDGVDLEVMSGAFYGIVGPNGAGKTTTLSMITGLLRPDAGTVSVNGADVWTNPVVAKRNMGVLPDRLRLFDRLTGAQLLYYAGALRGMDSRTVRHRSADLANAFGLEDALGRLVSDYSAGMTKKIALAAAMIHSPRLLVLDEPFESVDPVSAATVTDILKKYASEGGTVLLSSHSMDLVQRICDNVAVVVGGSILADGTMAAVRDGHTLEERFVDLAGGRKTVEGLEWLHSFSD